jgi:queuine/archaeosine tRNA-ribosyltransferase
MLPGTDNPGRNEIVILGFTQCNVDRLVNLHFYLDLMARARSAIENRQFDAFATAVRGRRAAGIDTAAEPGGTRA